MSARHASLRQAVEEAFSDEFLFEPANKVWRDMVTDHSTGAPKSIDPQMLLSFPSIVQFCSGTPTSMSEQILAAVKDSPIAEAGEKLIRRRSMLKPEDNPEKRTVFVKPIHADATDDDVMTFFAQCGTVTRVSRRHVPAGHTSKAHTLFFVTFKTVDEARTCCENPPQYTVPTCPLSALWIPTVTAVFRAEYESLSATMAVRASERQIRDTIARGGPPAGVETKQFLKPNHTVTVHDVPSGVTWSQLKAKLGNLSLNYPSLRGKIGLVRIVGDGRAFVICKTEEAAQALLVTFQQQVIPGSDAGRFIDELKKIAPRMNLCQGDEEAIVMKNYAEWVTPKVQHAQAQNQKRTREEA